MCGTLCIVFACVPSSYSNLLGSINRIFHAEENYLNFFIVCLDACCSHSKVDKVECIVSDTDQSVLEGHLQAANVFGYPPVTVLLTPHCTLTTAHFIFHFKTLCPALSSLRGASEALHPEFENLTQVVI